MIELRHLCKKYENVTPFNDINAVINDGDVISIIGPSGTGKSTLLRCINLLETPTSGKIIIDGVDITAKGCKINEIRKKVGMVFQNFNLFEHRTIIENVMQAPVKLLGLSKQEAYDKSMELLHMVGMDGRALDYPDMLSGGQKQRVAIARALAMNPDIILFDEPTSALDPTMVGEVQAVIRQLAHMGKSMMIVTHEMKFAREICNRVFYLDEGGIYEEGSPEQIFEHPQKELTRRFIKRLKVFETKIEGEDFDFVGVVSELEQYGFKNRISPKTIYRIQSVFEELCHELLLPNLSEIKIEFTVEYDEQSEHATIIVLYGGKNFNPMDSDNTLSLKIFESQIDKIEHNIVELNGFTNKLTIKIR